MQVSKKLKAAGDADAVVAIAEAEGFVISVEELKKSQAEISEEELEGVAGGVRGVQPIIVGKDWMKTDDIVDGLSRTI